MRSVLLTATAVCCLCGVGISPMTAKGQPEYEEFVGTTRDHDELAFAVNALWLAHEDLRVAHEDLVWAYSDLLAFGDRDERPGPPKGKGKDADKGKEKDKEGDKKKPPHAGPDKKPGGPPHKRPNDDAKPKESPHHEQILTEIRAIRELIEPGKKHHDKKGADQQDGPPHEQVLRELRELRKAVEKHHGKK